MRCSFCKADIEKGTGIMFVRRDGSILYFCSSKCRRNMLELQRNPRYLKWASKEKAKKKAK